MISNRLSLIKRSLGKERERYHYTKHCENFFFPRYFLQFSRSPTNATQDFLLPVDKAARGSAAVNAMSVRGTGDQNPLSPNVPFLRKPAPYLPPPPPPPPPRLLPSSPHPHPAPSSDFPYSTLSCPPAAAPPTARSSCSLPCCPGPGDKELRRESETENQKLNLRSASQETGHILSHQRNANSNYFEISSHASQKQQKDNKCWLGKEEPLLTKGRSVN
jgi:hypothetical protein